MYDTAHGQAHIDFLDHNGNKIDKTGLGFFFPFNDALQWCFKHVVANWRMYRQHFDANREED